MLSETLTLALYEVTPVATAAEALAMFHMKSVDLVLTDLHLAGASGFALALAIRRSGGKGARVPILGMTADPLLEDEQRCGDAGFSAMIAKPFTLATFIAAAERICG